MYPWEKDHNDPKKIIVTDPKGNREQVAYCASPEVASLVLHRCASQPVLLEACRAMVLHFEEWQVDEEAFEGCVLVRLAIAAADPTSKEPTP